MRIRWFGDGILDLMELRKYIADDNPPAALDVAGRIIQGVEYLRDRPAMGRPGRVEGTRELVVPGLSYIIPYRVKDNVVEVLRVLHSARRWPRKL